MSVKKCPAPAGMIPQNRDYQATRGKVPRTCGDDPAFGQAMIFSLSSAPHLRG